MIFDKLRKYFAASVNKVKKYTAFFKLVKAIGGVTNVFYKLILFYRVFTKFQIVFCRFKKFKLVFEI